MAQTYEYIDGAAGVHVLCESDVDGTYSVDAENGWDDSNVDLHIEDSPNRYYSHYRGFSYTVRDYVLILTVHAATPILLQAAKRQWAEWHNRELDEGYVRRTLEDGTVRCLDCIPGKPKWTYLTPSLARVEQHYMAAWPFWRDSSATTANGNMNDAVPVNLSCNNQGDIPGPMVATWTGIAHTSKLTNSDADWCEYRVATVNADDLIVADSRPFGATARYAYTQVHAAGALIAVATSSGSKLLWLPRGTHNLVVEGAGGETSSAALAISWYNYYESLY